MRAYVKTDGLSNNLSPHFRLEKNKQSKTTSSMKEKEQKSRKLRTKTNEAKSCFFEKINKTDKPLASLTKKNKPEVSNIRNKMWLSEFEFH